jgi:hypothetical protein
MIKKRIPKMAKMETTSVIKAPRARFFHEVALVSILD